MLNFKKIILTLSLIGGFCLPVADMVSNPKISINFDFHDVLFESDYRQHAVILTVLAAGAGLTYSAYKWFGYAPVALAAFGIGTIVVDLLNSLRKQTYRHEENAFKGGSITPYLLPIYKYMESVFKPNKEMTKLVKQLKKDDYTLNIASNINDGSLKILQDRYENKGNKNEFDFKDFTTILSPTKDNGYLNKRYKANKEDKDKAGTAFFKKLAEINQDAELVIYIDDKEKNCELAKNVIGEKCVSIKFKEMTVEQLHTKINEIISKHNNKKQEEKNN